MAPNATTYKWTLTYKPTKKATYRVVASVPAVTSTTTAGVTAVLAGKLDDQDLRGQVASVKCAPALTAGR